MGNRRFWRASTFAPMLSPTSRRFLRPLLNCAIVGGLMLACLPVAQTLYGRWSQHQLETQWKQQQIAAPKRLQRKNPIEKVTLAAPAVKAKVKPARWPLTKLSIAAINLETYAVQGWDDDSLRRGPGHDPRSAAPGEGNCVLAGHRNIYGSPFYKVDELMPGAPIILESRDGKFTYVTSRVFTTTDSDASIMAQPAPGATPMLTLITCTMPHTSNRIVVQAALSSEN